MTLTEADRIRDKRWITQCALSRICGGCAMSLGRPIAFLGDEDEVRRGVFHLPPMHLKCAEELRAGTDLELVTTAAFEFVRPGREDLDPLVRFELVGGAFRREQCRLLGSSVGPLPHLSCGEPR